MEAYSGVGQSTDCMPPPLFASYGIFTTTAGVSKTGRVLVVHGLFFFIITKKFTRYMKKAKPVENKAVKKLKKVLDKFPEYAKQKQEPEENTKSEGKKPEQGDK